MNIRVIEAQKPSVKKKKRRVAAYCRVSTDHSDYRPTNWNLFKHEGSNRKPMIYDTLPLPSQHIVLHGQEALSEKPMLPETLQFLHHQKSGSL